MCSFTFQTYAKDSSSEVLGALPLSGCTVRVEQSHDEGEPWELLLKCVTESRSFFF